MRTHDFTATLQFGTVAAVDAAKHAVRVTVPTLDDIQTDWLPVVSLGAGGNQFYALPDVGALAVCLLDARGEGGVCLGVIYNEQDGTPASDSNMWIKKFANGTVISHNRADGQVTVDTPGKVVVKAASKVEIQSPETEITGNTTVNGMLTYTAGLTASNGGGGDTASIDGTVRINGDIILNGISVSGHVHPGDSGGTTGSMQAG